MKRGFLLALTGQAAIILVIALALGEITLHVYNYFYPLPIFYTASYNRWRGKPFAAEYDFKLNSKGFKDVEHQIRKPPAAFRILGIGDSFAYGVVPHWANYLTLLEHDLNRTRPPVEMINMGIPSTGPRDYLNLLALEGLDLEPDMVLLSFFIGDDFEVPSRNHKYFYTKALVEFVVARYFAFAPGFSPDNRPYDDAAATLADDNFMKIEVSRSWVFQKDNKAFQEKAAAALSYLSEIKEICDRRNIPLVVVLIPDEMQVNVALQRSVVAASKLAPDAFDFARPNHLLGAELTSRDIDYLDLLEEFVAASADARLYRPNDTHWNIRGNDLAEKLILKHLMREPRSARQ
jgi:acetyltransferase AlgX (SGNH hydrolase-like protein)